MKRPFVIGVGGSHSGAGKTTVAAALLEALLSSTLPGFRALKRWGAIKYTKTELYTSISDDRTIIDCEGKDTGKLLGSGAEEVLWVQGPSEGLEETVSSAMDRLSHLDGIIIEGNSAIEFSNPDIVIFISGRCGEMEKVSALRLIKHADIIVFPGGSMPHAADKNIYSARVVYFDPEDKTTRQELLECMEAVIEERMFDKIKQLLKDKAVGGDLGCAAARHIAEELNASYSDVGKAANELKIKIKNCELGCF
jgi:molybdopterin-guanine dinucleotide biosynthesis protein